MRRLAPTLALTLALAACNGQVDDPMDAAESALQAGRSAKAVSLLQAHVVQLDKDGAEYREAMLLLCHALAESQPESARDTLLKLVEEKPESVTPRDFKDVQSYLQTHSHYSVAVDVMDAGLKRWKGDPTMLEVKDVLIARIQSAGDVDALAKLKGLGYM